MFPLVSDRVSESDDDDDGEEKNLSAPLKRLVQS